MTTKGAVIAIVLMLGAALAGSAVLYPVLPDRVPTHWNLHGEVDHWSSKGFGCLGIPGLLLLPLVFLAVGDWLSPRQFKVGDFRFAFNYLMVILAGLFAYLHALVLAAALHPHASFARWLIGGIFLFFAWIGNLLGKTRRNFWIGIRTPWTLSSDAVWIATHRFGARVFMATGILGALAVALGADPVWCFALFLAAICVPVLYSFRLSKKLEKQQAGR